MPTKFQKSYSIKCLFIDEIVVNTISLCYNIDTLRNPSKIEHNQLSCNVILDISLTTENNAHNANTIGETDSSEWL